MGWDGWTIDPVRRVLAIENRSQSQKRLSTSESASFRSMGIEWRIRRMNRASSKLSSSRIYFIAPDGKLMAVSIAAQGSTFAAATPVALFPASPVSSGPASNKQEYASPATADSSSTSPQKPPCRRLLSR